jgi:hypothetical protein
VVNQLAQRTAIESCSIRPLWWQEIDNLADLERTRAVYLGRSAGMQQAS